VLTLVTRLLWQVLHKVGRCLRVVWRAAQSNLAGGLSQANMYQNLGKSIGGYVF
jgi:hypothetical protein